MGHRLKREICDGFSRRRAIQAGGLASLGITLPGFWQRAALAGAENGGTFGRAKSCIVLFMLGGPDQHSTFDPKPAAPAEVRGEHGAAISTVVPGIELGELWPRTALVTDKLAILRAMSTGDNAHSSSGYYMLTGQPHVPMNVEGVNPGFPNDFPNLGATVRQLAAGGGQLPAAVRLPHHIWNTDGSVWPGQDAGFLGGSAEPWLLNCRPADSQFRIDEFGQSDDLPAQRLALRRELLSQVNESAASSGNQPRYDRLTERAFDVLDSD